MYGARVNAYYMCSSRNVDCLDLIDSTFLTTRTRCTPTLHEEAELFCIVSSRGGSFTNSAAASLLDKSIDNGYSTG
jgi:hypothetical protein